MFPKITISKINPIIILLLIIFFGSCKKDKKESELALIVSYIEKENLKGDIKESGLFYSNTGFSTPETLESDFPKQGDTIKTIYKAYVLSEENNKFNLTLFDSTSLQVPGIYIYKEDPVIPGWEEAIGLMKKDISAIVIIPSDLAYGDNQVGIIPPYSPLVFNIRVLDIISQNN